MADEVPAKVEGSAGVCKACRLWALPSWETGGFGTCHLPSARAAAKLLPVIKVRPAFSWLATHETFGCLFFVAK